MDKLQEIRVEAEDKKNTSKWARKCLFVLSELDESRLLFDNACYEVEKLRIALEQIANQSTQQRNYSVALDRCIEIASDALRIR